MKSTNFENSKHNNWFESSQNVVAMSRKNRNNKFVFLIIINSASDLVKFWQDYSKSDGGFSILNSSLIIK